MDQISSGLYSVCPANHESAGRQKRRGTRKGNVHLKTTLMTAAVAATNKKGSFWRDKYYRLKVRLGAKRAAMAIAHKILVTVFVILSRKQPFQDLGPAVLEGAARVNAAKRLVRRLATCIFRRKAPSGNGGKRPGRTVKAPSRFGEFAHP